MELQINISEEYVNVRLSGQMHNENASILDKELKAHIIKGYSNYHVDMRELEYIDSAGLGVLFALNKAVRASGGTVILAGLAGTVKELFEVTEARQVFTICDE